MNGLKISEAARATGFTESALRFYEQEGVVVPERTESGYRSYRDDDIEALRFVSRAKQLGLQLGEMPELLSLLQDDECRPLQTRMRQLVHEQIDGAQRRISALVSFTAQLQDAVAHLSTHTPDGACDSGCGCRIDPAPSEAEPTRAVALAGTDSPAVACSLAPDLIEGRVEDWKSTIEQAKGREMTTEGVRLRFSRDVDVAALSGLAAAEQTCCGFLTFTIGIHPDEVIFDVAGPTGARSVISAMFGVAA